MAEVLVVFGIGLGTTVASAGPAPVACVAPPVQFQGAPIDPTGTSDSSRGLQWWLASMPSGATVCLNGTYLVNGSIHLNFSPANNVVSPPANAVFGLTIIGGTFVSTDGSCLQVGICGPGTGESACEQGTGNWNYPPEACPGSVPILKVIGGTHLTLVNVTFRDANTESPPGTIRYIARMSTRSPLELDGTIDTTLVNYHASGVWGYGINMEPLRLHGGWYIVNPVEGIVITNATMDGGTQGIAPVDISASPDRANLFTNINITAAGQSAWDFEDDSSGQGASNYTINGCWGRTGFSVTGQAGRLTGPALIENCNQTTSEPGPTALLMNMQPITTTAQGSITFNNDYHPCGHAGGANFACFNDAGPNNVVITHSCYIFTSGASTGTFWNSQASSSHGNPTLTISNSIVYGYGSLFAGSASNFVNGGGNTFTPAPVGGWGDSKPAYHPPDCPQKHQNGF